MTRPARPGRCTGGAIRGEPDGLVDEIDVRTTDIIEATVVVFDPGEFGAVLEDVRLLGLTAEAAPSAALPGAMFVNVNGREADKGKGRAFAAEHLGVSLDDVVAVGDGLNDPTQASRRVTRRVMRGPALASR